MLETRSFKKNNDKARKLIDRGICPICKKELYYEVHTFEVGRIETKNCKKHGVMQTRKT